jgi:type VI secretion system secreted protein Hcp
VQGPQGATGATGPAGSGGSGLPVDPCNGNGGVAYVANSQPNYDIFLKMDDIQGESLDKAHKGEIDVSSFSWGGVVNPVSTSGSGVSVGKSHPCPVNVIKVGTDRATPGILQAAATGSHIQEVTFSLVKSGGLGPFTFAQYKFEDVTLTSGGDVFGFVFQKVTVTYTTQKADGSAGVTVPFTYDFNSKL